MTATPAQRRAAHLAAERIEAMLLEMLVNGDVGEVVIAVGLFELTPLKRVTTKGKAVKVAQGRVLVESVR